VSLASLAVCSPLHAEPVEVQRGAMASAAAGAAGACLFTDSATEDNPCQYLAGIELTMRPRIAWPIRLLGGARLAAYTNDYFVRGEREPAYYRTSGVEAWLGLAWRLHRIANTDTGEVVLGVGRGFGTTTEWDNYPNTGRLLNETPNVYWMGDLGYQMIHASPSGWFATLRAATTIVRFAPRAELKHDLGWQWTTAPLPRVELGLGVHF
jgi:hypothetical protein